MTQEIVELMILTSSNDEHQHVQPTIFSIISAETDVQQWIGNSNFMVLVGYKEGGWCCL